MIMPDIREILKALSPEDKTIWETSRTKMRATFIGVHGATVGSENWTAYDDAFLDLIDIRLALLFEQSGKIAFNGKEIVSPKDAEPIEEAVKQAEDEVKSKAQYPGSTASRMLANMSNIQNQSNEFTKNIKSW